ncbi:MAG TPA: molybdate ABC transporter substrate-binding protein [Pseudonocardiaceae bacterium]
MTRRHRVIAGLLAGAAALGPAGCGAAGAPSAGGSGSEPAGEVVVFAAASLTDTFTRLGEDFEAANPGVTVTLNFAGSSALAQQITQGAPADVFAAAAPAPMRQAGATDPATFALNTLQIAVPAGNPAGVSGLADLGDPARTVALCAEQVPCGAAALAAFTAAGITPRPDTLEQDVRAVLAKVRLGEVDAGLVYRTDVRAAGDDVEGIDFPEATQAVNEYPIAVLPQAPNAATARAFVAFVLSDHGRAVLTAAGFDLP